MKKNHVLITGGAGYIGSVLTPLLLENGYSVTVIDTLMFEQLSLISCFQYRGFAFVKGDACNPGLLNDYLPEAEYIIPLAAIVGSPACSQFPSQSKLVNYDAIKLILNKLTPTQKILFPNTNSGYGKASHQGICTEETPLKPLSLYGKLKVQIEKALLITKQAVSFRLATVFGLSPRMRLDLLVNDFTYRACLDRSITLFEEHFKRNYIHVADIAETFLFGIQNFEKMAGNTYNVGLSNTNLSKRELCERIKRHIPDFCIHTASTGKDPDQRDYIVSNAKLEALGWRPKRSLDDGIQELIKAFSILKKRPYVNY